MEDSPNDGRVTSKGNFIVYTNPGVYRQSSNESVIMTPALSQIPHESARRDSGDGSVVT